MIGSGSAESRYSPSPVVYQAHPAGAQRGTATVVTVEGINLRGTSRLLFHGPGVSARILEVAELPTGGPSKTAHERLRIALDVGAAAETGVHGFRLVTPFGTTNWVPFAIGQFPERPATETNVELASAERLAFPVTVNGCLRRPGEAHYYAFAAGAGDEITFVVEASRLGSKLDSVLAILDGRGERLAENDNFFAGRPDSLLAHRFAGAGRYILRISDAAERAGEQYHYRLTAGRFPCVTGIFPLGVERGTMGRVRIRGYNLGGAEDVEVDGHLPPDENGFLSLKVKTPRGEALFPVQVALGKHRAVREREPNDTVAEAQSVELPVTMDGQVGRRGDRDLYRFRARAGEAIALEVSARRLGSLLDSFVEVLDQAGRVVPRAFLEGVVENLEQDALDSHTLDLSRLDTFTKPEFFPGDFVLIEGVELVRLQEAMRYTDGFSVAQGYLGQRLAWLGTTAQNHAALARVYKVRVMPPGGRPASADFPIFRLDYQNDDGGPTFGKDSYLLFTPPNTGDYFVRLRDVRDLGGERFGYRLTIRRATPGFRLFFDDTFSQHRDGRAAGARNPNVPRGGCVPVTVSVHRIDGFAGEVAVEVTGLPAGTRATSGIIREGEFHTSLLVSADPDAVLDAPVPLRVLGRARSAGREVVETAQAADEPMNLISVVPPAMVSVYAEPERLVIQPEGTARLSVRVKRHDGFAGDVGVEVKNLPPGLFVTGRSGAAGITIGEGESYRTIVLQADPSLSPGIFPIFAVVRVKSERAATMRGIASLGESADYGSSPILVSVEQGARSERQAGRGSGVRPDGR